MRTAAWKQPTAFRKFHSGNPIAMKLVLERLIPAAQDRHVNLDLGSATRSQSANPLRTTTPSEVLNAHNRLLHSVADGELTPLEAQAISALLEARRRSWEATELAQRLSNLEDKIEQSKGGRV